MEFIDKLIKFDEKEVEPVIGLFLP